jgi:uncharacterized phage-associated protein
MDDLLTIARHGHSALPLTCWPRRSSLRDGNTRFTVPGESTRERSRAGIAWRAIPQMPSNSAGMARSANLNEKKATQVAARFLAAAGAKLPYMSLLKLMYIADREALRRWRSPVTNDRYVSMKLGPVLSGVYDLLVVPPEVPTYWHRHISSPERYEVSLLEDPGDDELSRAEEKLVDEIFATYSQCSQWDLSDLTHEFQEWADPDGSSIPIDVKDILRAVGADAAEADAIAKDLNGFNRMRALSNH